MRLFPCGSSASLRALLPVSAALLFACGSEDATPAAKGSGGGGASAAAGSFSGGAPGKGGTAGGGGSAAAGGFSGGTPGKGGTAGSGTTAGTGGTETRAGAGGMGMSGAGGNGGTQAPGGNGGMQAPGGNGGAPPVGGTGGTGAGGDPVKPMYGRFGEAKETFTLVAGDAGNGFKTISEPDVQKKYPTVKWDTLDRLYVPAGTYRNVLIQNLPKRDKSRPLVITNLGGQVVVGGAGAGHGIALGGGANWIFTGRFDPESKTGNESFVGHATGKYAHSQDTYGFLVDDKLVKEGLSGLAVGGYATDFELEMFEVRNVDFAGIVAKTDDKGDATMTNVRLHDVYVHDTGSEGIYFGSTQKQPQHTFVNLTIHDNRFLRTGTEALQVGQQGDGCEIHHNVIGPGATRWRSAFQGYQDGNVQYGQRTGSSSFHHNLVVGTGDLFVELFPTPVASDTHGAKDTITFADNYFADTASGGVYTHADENQVTIKFEHNVFRGFRFTYDEVYPDANAPLGIFGVGANTKNPHVLTDNGFDIDLPFVKYPFPTVTQTNNVKKDVPAVTFRDFLGPEIEADFRRLEWWTPTATLSPSKGAVTYPVGFTVLHKGKLYRALAANTGKEPDKSPDVWNALPDPADDARLSASSAFQGVGLQQPPP